VGADYRQWSTAGTACRSPCTSRSTRHRPPEHQIFVHLERRGTLLNGDHHPLGGIFPTTLWRPGDHLRDRHVVELPRVLTPPGRYRIHVGLWPGGNTDSRLAVTAGEHDGRDRVALGSVEVQ
jgi:hypothetical protein